MTGKVMTSPEEVTLTLTTIWINNRGGRHVQQNTIGRPPANRNSSRGHRSALNFRREEPSNRQVTEHHLNLQQSPRTPRTTGTSSKNPDLKTNQKRTTQSTISMFSTSSSSKVTVVYVAAALMMMMMTMMTEGAAVTKHAGKTHRKLSGSVSLETVPLQLNHNTFSRIRNIRPLHNASISPWTYNISRDDSLYPPVLSEARCLLQGCLDSEGQEDLGLESRPIMHQVLLLRRVKSAGAESGSDESYHFRLESRLIAVGCTCVRPIIKHQQ
ncbi:interleukin-17F-like [Labrus bergylta]|uniref:interleukin-17F-like n=1 Tax=Labrus bergylta TaxID=56723 RepID=UPI0033133FF8